MRCCGRQPTIANDSEEDLNPAFDDEEDPTFDDSPTTPPDDVVCRCVSGPGRWKPLEFVVMLGNTCLLVLGWLGIFAAGERDRELALAERGFVSVAVLIVLLRVDRTACHGRQAARNCCGCLSDYATCALCLACLGLCVAANRFLHGGLELEYAVVRALSSSLVQTGAFGLLGIGANRTREEQEEEGRAKHNTLLFLNLLACVCVSLLSVAVLCGTAYIDEHDIQISGSGSGYDSGSASDFDSEALPSNTTLEAVDASGNLIDFTGGGGYGGGGYGGGGYGGGGYGGGGGSYGGGGAESSASGFDDEAAAFEDSDTEPYATSLFIQLGTIPTAAIVAGVAAVTATAASRVLTFSGIADQIYAWLAALVFIAAACYCGYVSYYVAVILDVNFLTAYRTHPELVCSAVISAAVCALTFVETMIWRYCKTSKLLLLMQCFWFGLGVPALLIPPLVAGIFVSEVFALNKSEELEHIVSDTASSLLYQAGGCSNGTTTADWLHVISLAEMCQTPLVGVACGMCAIIGITSLMRAACICISRREEINAQAARAELEAEIQGHLARQQAAAARRNEYQARQDAEAAQAQAAAAIQRQAEATHAASQLERQLEHENAVPTALLAPLCTTTRDLLRDSEPWTEIEARVQQSLPQHVVTRLQQVHNNQLLMDFNRQKEIVAAKPANRDGVNVRLAFHAMAGGPDELKQIYEAGREEGGFDFRLGRAGAYGRGSYFAEHAIYSAYMYPRPDKAPDGSITLLVAEVILGQSGDYGSRIDGTLVREPPIEGGAAGDVWDSVQGTENSFGINDHTHHPRPDARRYGKIPGGCEDYGKQYVVYKKEKAYPRYVVTIRHYEGR